jgi:hypothetical protein
LLDREWHRRGAPAARHDISTKRPRVQSPGHAR